MKSKIRSIVIMLLLHPNTTRTKRFLSELKRRLLFRKHRIRVFLQLDDPYSYLLIHYLQFVKSNYNVEIELLLSQSLRGDFAPEPAKQAEYAVSDCRMVAAELGVPFLDVAEMPVVEHRRPLLTLLAEEQGQDDFFETFQEALTVYWRGDQEGAARLVSNVTTDQAETNVLVSKNQLLLRKLGHYNSAMMLYAGEWYWGVDRLHYLVDRLDGLGVRQLPEAVPEIASMRQAMSLALPAAIPASASELPAVDYFHSFRSPYSYLSLKRTFEIADAFGVQLNIKPVLPMVMRGMKMPRNKLIYIARDANREAQTLDVPFGKFADPVGEGVKRALAVFFYARSQGKEREFMLACGNGSWAEAIDIATDEGLREVTEKAGLFWPDVLTALEDDDWKAMAEANREELTSLGLWGVPSYRFEDACMWGQDRAWLLARKLEDRCHDGDGIMT